MPYQDERGIVVAGDGEMEPTGGPSLLAEFGKVADAHAAASAFSDFLARKAPNTITAYRLALRRFAAFLAAAGLPVGDLDAAAESLMHDPTAWRDVTWGMVEGFRGWQLSQGDAVSSINQRLSAIKVFVKLAGKVGAISQDEAQRIKAVSGYGPKEAGRVDDQRDVTRRGRKKAAHVRLTEDDAHALKHQPDTPQGRRDALLMALLLDHGLRVGEIAGLRVGDFDLARGTLRVYRPKVDKTQTLNLSADTRRAARAYFTQGDVPIGADELVLRESRKNGALAASGMTERGIAKRVRALGDAIGVAGLSPHDCRHYWATYWAGRVDRLPRGLFTLQEAGGWAGLDMPRRYADEAAIANEGMA